MAKEIRAVESPKCGSVQKTEIRKDYFLCRNCGTEYVLDNDDITITHNVNYSHSHPVQPSPYSKKVANIAVSVFLIFMVGSLLFIWLGDFSGSNNITTDINTGYQWSHKDEIAYTGTNEKPVLAILGYRYSYSNSKNEEDRIDIVFYDLMSDKELRTQQITSLPKSNNQDIKFRIFENGDIYGIVNKMHLFKIDKTGMAAKDVTDKIFRGHPELSTGVANMEFVSKDYGSGFQLLTNDGKKYYYYPIADRVYTDKEHHETQQELSVRDAKAKVNTYFDFSYKASMYPNEPIKLMKFTQKDNAGGPDERPYFEYGEEYVDGGRQKTMFRWGEKLVLSYEDFTPGRLYFSPEVLYNDDKHLLLSYNTTAVQESNTSLQCMDANTAKVLFTIPFGERKYFDKDNVVKYKDGFIIKTNVSVLVISMKGQVIKEFKTL